MAFLGIYQFTCQSLGIISITLYHQELRRWAQTSNFVTFKNILGSDLVFFNFFWTCPLLPPAVVGSQFFPAKYQSLEVKGPFSHLTIPVFPSPNTLPHSKAFADVATCPHEYTSFVHWKAQILCKKLLLYHLAICEFFSSLDVCEKAEIGGQNPNHL